MKDRELGRLYMMADAKQAIYTSEWLPPTGVTTLELTSNVRNPAKIGAIVERLGGAPVARGSAPGPDVHVRTASGLREARKHVERSISYAMDSLHIPPSQILVLTPHRDLRDSLIQEVGGNVRLSRWENRTEETATCETVHRTKGLERQAVILVDLDEVPDLKIAYIGLSRASAYLSVTGRQALIRAITSEKSGGVEEHQRTEHEECGG